MTGVALKVTEVPAQTVVAEAAMETLTGNRGFTVMVTVFETAGLPVAQVAFEVSVQVMALVFTGTYVYAALVAPLTLVPFTFHR